MCEFKFDLQRQKLPEQVAARIERLICEEELTRGERLPGERELAERLGVCRTVVREAIRILEARGLLSVKPGCGTYVNGMTPDDLAAPLSRYLRLCGAQATREGLEVLEDMAPLLASHVAKRAPGEAIETLVDAVEALGNSADMAGALASFWRALGQAAPNHLYSVVPVPLLETFHRQLNLEAAEGWDPWDRWCRAILAAIQAHDGAQAAAAAGEYMQALGQVHMVAASQTSSTYESINAGGV